MPKKKLLPPALASKISPQEVRQAIHKIFEQHNYDPFKELIFLATATVPTEVNGQTINLPLCDIDQRILIARELASYVAPKLKNMEVSGTVDNQLTIKVKMIGLSNTGQVGAINVPSEVLRNGSDVQKVLQDKNFEHGAVKKDVLGEVEIEDEGEDGEE
jgi:hypothetical protein